MLNHLKPFWQPVIERLPFRAVLYFSPGATNYNRYRAPQKSLIIYDISVKCTTASRLQFQVKENVILMTVFAAPCKF